MPITKFVKFLTVISSDIFLPQSLSFLLLRLQWTHTLNLLLLSHKSPCSSFLLPVFFLSVCPLDRIIPIDLFSSLDFFHCQFHSAFESIVWVFITYIVIFISVISICTFFSLYAMYFYLLISSVFSLPPGAPLHFRVFESPTSGSSWG